MDAFCRDLEDCRARVGTLFPVEGRKEKEMLLTLRRYVPVVGLIAVLIGQNLGAALLPDEAVDLMATRLDQNQVKAGGNAGLWRPEVLFMGPTTGGMACAYRWTGNPDYKASAELAGYYILWFTDVQGNLLGDEVIAFLQLSEASDDPTSNVWRSAIEEWFVSMRRPGYEGSTREYIRYFEDMEVTTAVFYIANHTVGAYYVDDQDKAIWREALIEYLSRVDDEAGFPVMALGVATWALAETGALDDTPVTSLLAKAYWDGVVLSDLPGILASQQVSEGEAFAGSFYWRFDHTSGGTGGIVAGYTEDAVFGALGLVAAAPLEQEAVDPNADPQAEGEIQGDDLSGSVEAAQRALLEGIDEEGRVFEHLGQAGQTYYAYTGEMLQTLWSIEEYLASQPDPAAETDPDAELETDDELVVEAL